jgi:sarcosine oxidase/L-pipecolate oxidase
MIPIELIKIGGTELHTRIYNLIIKVWEEDKMPEKWNFALYCPIYKKGNKTLCSNYRSIALLDVVYKVFSKIISKRCEPYVEDIVGNYQIGFIRNKSTIDQILP